MVFFVGEQSMKKHFPIVWLLLFTGFCHGGKICEITVGDEVRLFTPFFMTAGTPCEWSVSVTNKNDFPVQIGIMAFANGKHYWGEYSFSVGHICVTNHLDPGKSLQIRNPLDENWMPSNRAPDTIEFLIFTTNLTTGSHAGNFFCVGTSFPAIPGLPIPDTRGTPITRDDFPPE